MDIATHFALGICTTEVLRKSSGGKKILFWGAFVQCLPDIDTIPAVFMPLDRSLMVHRGITHSLFFALIAALILSLIIFKAFKKEQMSFFFMFLFVFFQLALHDLLDVCNAYGTGLLEPFSRDRFSVNLLYVADPIFSIGLVIAAFVLLLRRNIYLHSVKWAWGALILSVIYLCYAWVNKIDVDRRIDEMLQSRQISFKKYMTTPAPLNSMLWYIVIDTDSSYYTGYRSVFDPRSSGIDLEQHPKNYFLLNAVQGEHAVQNFKDFAAGYYTISGTPDHPYINILRFGQIHGWEKKNAPFVLSCSLLIDNRAAALQEGRFAGWGMNELIIYVKRIAGTRK